jgi:hypothetical protein
MKKQPAQTSAAPSGCEGKLSPKLLHILQHSLGVDQYGRGNQYRNYFATGPGCDNFGQCNELVSLGFMEDHGPLQVAGGLHYFAVTPNGIDVVAFQSPLPPKVSRGRQRYLDYLEIADCFTSFLHYLQYTAWKKKEATF